MFLIYLPKGTSVYRARGGESASTGSVKGFESWKNVFPGWHFLFTCSDTFATGCIV